MSIIEDTAAMADADITRRSFVQVLGAGLLIAAAPGDAAAQPRRGGGGFRGGGPVPLGARLHIADDGIVTVMTGKVEGGQGARAQIAQAAAEELRVLPQQLRLIMADTSLVPDDGITAGSRTTPSTLPAVRQACAAARQLLIATAATQWQVSPDAITVAEAAARDPHGDRRLTYADLAKADVAGGAMAQQVPQDVSLTRVEQWEVMGQSLPRPNGRDIVTGAHVYPSDIARTGMLYGKILRPPSYGVTLQAVDVEAARQVNGAVPVHDGNFVGVAAPSTHLASRALAVLDKSATWEPAPHPDSNVLYEHLRRHADVPPNPHRQQMESAAHVLRATYNVAYVQHVPMEPRAAVAEWEEGRLTVWTATQNPFGVRRELAGAFRIAEDHVRVIVPDFGGGFGGKHTGETAIEAAQLAQAAKKPVAVRWTRAEEFTWAAFRPAAVIDVEASLDDQGRLTSWHFININSGRAGIDTPYRVTSNVQYIQSEAPLRHGSYRALASAANMFARESAMDELAHVVEQDPLAFRLAHLQDPRLRAVLEDAAGRFRWNERRSARGGVGVGLACGIEKSSYVAACVEVVVEDGQIQVREVCQSYECGKITSPRNLRAQVEGCIIMALGPALSEAMEFSGGSIRNASLWQYQVPRMKDLPKLQISLIDRADLPSVGAGETPLIALAPAIGNAVFHATGQRLREMPMRLGASPAS
jgi:isoquinoline 1-oxidoreductase subunit beta